MRTDTAIKDKLRQAIFRYRKKHIQRIVQVCPANCRFNRDLDLPDGTTVGTCGHSWEDGGDWPGICDEQYDGDTQASMCPHFSNRYDKDAEKQAFRDFFAKSSLAEIAAQYPDVAALLWAMGDEDSMVRDVEIPDDEDWVSPLPQYVMEIIGIPIHVATEGDLELLAAHFTEIDAALKAERNRREQVEAAVRTSPATITDDVRRPDPIPEVEEMEPPPEVFEVADIEPVVRKPLLDQLGSWWSRR